MYHHNDLHNSGKQDAGNADAEEVDQVVVYKTQSPDEPVWFAVEEPFFGFAFEFFRIVYALKGCAKERINERPQESSQGHY